MEPTRDESYQGISKRLVLEYVVAHLDKTDEHSVGPMDIYVVWACKTLQNWKALVSTTLLDGMYYEVTYNGDKKEVYLDAYKKFDNIKIALEEDREDASSNLVARAHGHQREIDRLVTTPPGTLPPRRS